MRDSDIVQHTHDESDLAERVVADKEHDDGGNDDVDRIAHTREISFASDGRAGCGVDGGWL